MKHFPRRVLFVSDACLFGGAERYILDMAAAARRLEIEPAICWLPVTASPEDLFAVGENLIPLFRSSSAGPRRRYERRSCLREALRSFRPDAAIINAAGRPRFWQACWQARAAGIPVAWVHHMVEQQDPRRVPPQWFGGTVEGPQWWRVPQALRHRLAARAATAVITSNPADRNRIARWHRVNPTKIHVIPPGVDCARFRSQPRERTPSGFLPPLAWVGSGGCTPFVIGTAARLVTRKGIEPLIEATARLRARGIPALLIIAGQGPQRRAFEKLAAEQGLTEAARFLGFVTDMPGFYNSLDVFALCSETESFGLALGEAMSCERPVIATPTDGARQQLLHLSSGWQLSSFAIEELTGALASLYEAPQLRARLGREGRASVQRSFSVDQTLERTLHVLTARGANSRSDRAVELASASSTG